MSFILALNELQFVARRLTNLDKTCNITKTQAKNQSVDQLMPASKCCQVGLNVHNLIDQ